MLENPNLWKDPRCRFLRKFVSQIERNPDVYGNVDGDDTISMPVPESDRGQTLTKGYIEALAQLRSGSDVSDTPVLCVFSKVTKQRTINTPGHEDARPVMMT